MSTYTVVSDVHANWPALEAVLADAPETDGLICLGDLVGLCGFPAEVVEYVREHATYCLQGNHDLSTIEWGEGHVNSTELSYFELETTLDSLEMDDQLWVNDRQTYMELEDEGLLLTHAKPVVEESSGFERGNAGIEPAEFTHVGANVDDWVSVMLMGHTHEQHAVDMQDFDGEHKRIVANPGSVGQPIIGPAEYAIVDTAEPGVELRECSFDTKRVIEQLRELEVPIEWWRR